VPELPLITSDDFAVLEPEWAALWAQVPGATPFLHPAWQKTWLAHFGQDAAAVFLSIRRDESLIGVATLDIDRDEARELGDHNVRDYAGPLVLPGEEEAVAAGVLEWLREDLTPNVTFWGLPADGATRGALFKASEGSGFSLTETHEAVCPGVDLPSDFEEFVASLSKKDRHELRRKMRNLEAAGQVTFTSVTSADELDAGLDALFHLMRVSRGDKDEFLTPRKEGFFRGLAATFGALGMVRLSTLSLDGTPAAMTFAFEDADTVYLYNSGFDPAFGHLAVGLISKAYGIRDAIGRGKRRFDFLRGSEDYKTRLGGSDRELVTLRLSSASV
jgi:CelD/BcsL family acetyltransferase involved in cellulose biosynthesis